MEAATLQCRVKMHALEKMMFEKYTEDCVPSLVNVVNHQDTVP